MGRFDIALGKSHEGSVIDYHYIEPSVIEARSNTYVNDPHTRNAIKSLAHSCVKVIREQSNQELSLERYLDQIACEYFIQGNVFIAQDQTLDHRRIRAYYSDKPEVQYEYFFKHWQPIELTHLANKQNCEFFGESILMCADHTSKRYTIVRQDAVSLINQFIKSWNQGFGTQYVSLIEMRKTLGIG
jgi:hypothetical protein